MQSSMKRVGLYAIVTDHELGALLCHPSSQFCLNESLTDLLFKVLIPVRPRVFSRDDMARFVARHIAPEMLALLVLESALSFGLAISLLSPGGLDGPTLAAADQAGVVAATVGFTSLLLGLYRPQLFMRARSLWLNTALGGALAFPAVWAVMSALGMRADWIMGPDRAWPAKILVTWIAALFSVRLVFLLAVRSKAFVRRIATIGPVSEVAGAVAAIRAEPAGLFEIVPARPLAEAPDGLREAGIRTALVSEDRLRGMSAMERSAFTLAGVALEPEPAFWERHLKRVDIDHLTADWFKSLDRHPVSPVVPVLERVGDVLTSLLLLVFTSPLILLVALLVRLDSPGPALYRQIRVGRDGKPFTLLKFRSMRADAEARGPAWAQVRDPRVTRMGLFMRRTRIDELPQLLNVLRGEMSFIGPRPERPHFVEKLAEVIPFYQERARVKPGLTGWAQVNYPYGASIEDAKAKLSYDLFYVHNRSSWLDLCILLATVRVILFQEGAR